MANTSKGRFPSYGLVRGPSHSQGGVPASVANGPDVELEGGEYIIPKEAVPDYLPVLQQITQVGRDRQQMQNGNTAIDALIASASMQNGIAQPKSPVYQEGGRISNVFKKQKENFQRAAMMGEKTGTRNPFLKTAEEQLALQARDTSPLSMRRESPNISLGELEEVALAQPYRPEVMSAREQVNMLPDEALEEIQMSQDTFEPFGRIPNMPEDERGNFLNYLFGGRDNLITTRSLLEDILGLRTSKEQGGMVQYEDGGELDIRRSPMPIQSPKMLGEDSIDSILSIINQGKRNGVNVADTPEYKRYNKSYNLLTKNTKKGVPPAEGEIDRVTNDYLVDISTKAYLMNELIKSGQYDNIGQIKDDFINLDLKDTMPKMEEGGEVHSRRMYNQGTGFDKKKSDLDGDGKISEYERKRGMAIAKAMGKMQMGGMVDGQPMMQRPMNPAMNFSPMQRMNPRMYQEGGQVQPRKQFELRNPETFIGPPDSLIGRVYMNPFTGEFEDADAQDKRIEEQIKRLRQRMKQSEIPSSKERVPMQEGGQVQLRRQAEKNTMSRQPKEKMDVIFPFLESIPRYLYPDFMGPRSPKQMLEVEDLFDEILRNAKGDRKYYIPDYDKEETGMKMAQEGGMVSNNNLMGSIASDQRVAPLQPDVYQSKSENGVTIEQRVEVPKLAEAILPIYGLETPLSKNQGSMLKRNNVTPNVLNPQVKGLINRVLVQRLAAEGS